MRIQLNQSELEKAVVAYISSQGVDISNKSVDVDFTAGRGQNGITVDVDINEPGTPSLTMQVSTHSEPAFSEENVPEDNSEEEETPAASLFGS